MTDKQIIIDYKNLCENYNKEVGCYGTFDGNCIKEQCFTYKLLQQLQAKEQECEELKKIIDEAKNSKLDLNSFFAIEATVGEYQLELDQLKAENDELKFQNKRLDEVASYWHKRIFKVERSERKLKQTLLEIKELLLKTPTDSPMHCVNAKSVILQKISECEGNNENL